MQFKKDICNCFFFTLKENVILGGLDIFNLYICI